MHTKLGDMKCSYSAVLLINILEYFPSGTLLYFNLYYLILKNGMLSAAENEFQKWLYFPRFSGFYLLLKGLIQSYAGYE